MHTRMNSFFYVCIYVGRGGDKHFIINKTERSKTAHIIRNVSNKYK